MQQYAVETFNLIKRFGNYTAVDGLNLRTERGTHSLLGPNGDKKSFTPQPKS